MSATLLSSVRTLFAIFYVLHVASIDAKQRSRKLDDVLCGPDSYRFDFTECDASGGRWRVAVPQSGCEGDVFPVPPKRLNDCYKSCEAGQFFNLTSLECEDCEAGAYSLGGGLRFDEWDTLPPGFKTQEEKFHSIFSTIGRQSVNVNCSKWGWKAKGEVLLSQGGPCMATLAYSALLVKPGYLKFTYQYSDDSVLFEFQANSDQCESLREAEGSRWPPITGEGIWRVEKIPLRTGLNIFQWKTMGVESHRPKPVLIRKIEIDGVGYTSSCNPCTPGTFSERPASNQCTECPKNTYSGHKHSRCLPCKIDTEYADEGSAECSPRPPCTPSDYYQIHTPCNDLNQTRIKHKWVQPKICIDTHPDSVKLPADGPVTECPPCNPGTEYMNGKCQPCPDNHYSDGRRQCSPCPAHTVAETGHHLTQWYSWPDSIHTTCVSPENDSGCNLAPAWQLSGNSVVSGKGHADWVYLLMTLSVRGFRGRGGFVNGELLQVGRLSFTFEIQCVHDCELIFMQGTSSKNATIIQRWVGSQRKQEFNFSIVRNDSYTFSWAFQKLTWDSINADGNLRDDNGDTWSKAMSDMDNLAKIYEIHVYNSIDGGARSCAPCEEGLIYSENSNYGAPSCVSCGPGQYRASFVKKSNVSTTNTSEQDSTSKCQPCPPGTVTVDPNGMDASACRQCGSGLISKDGLTCTTDCVVRLGRHTYDLRPLKGFKTIRGNRLFTTSGTQYYHVFNISFCMDANAECYNNVTLQHGFDSQNSKVQAIVCQSNVFPPAVTSSEAMSNDFTSTLGSFISKPLSTHASSLGDHLIGISHLPSFKGIHIEESISKHLNHPQQFHFYYSTPERTLACPGGRSTTITFRCRMTANAWVGVPLPSSYRVSTESEIRAPEKCPGATCDGCNFHFIWETQYACPVCTEAELKIVRGECKFGLQEIHYLPTEFSQCLLKHNSSWPTTQKCTNHLPVFVEIAVQFAVGVAIILSVALICFWRRHRKLEYKYMKLVASERHSSSHDGRTNGDDAMGCERGMLPVAESCALDPEDGDDEDDEDGCSSGDMRSRELPGQMKEVGFSSEGALKTIVSKFGMLTKLKNFTRKGESGTNLEIMNLTDKEAMT